MELKFLKNRTERTQSCYYKNQRITIDARAEEAFPPEIAEAFLKQSAGDVVELPTSLGTRAEVEKPATMFIANWTGNPDATETTKKVKYNKQTDSQEFVNVPNPLKEPKSVYRIVGGGQDVVLSKAGTEMFMNHPARSIEFPPFQFKELPRDLGEQLISQENLSPEWLSGQIREVRPPSNFQPDMTWTLEDMRDYLHIMDPDCPLGPSQQDLEKQAKGNEAKLQVDVIKAKRMCMKRLFFRLYDSAFHRPTKELFDEIQGKTPDAGLSDDEALKILEKANREAVAAVHAEADAKRAASVREIKAAQSK